MPAVRSNSAHVLRDFAHATSAKAGKKSAQLVFNAFSAALGHRRVDQRPFDADQNALDVAVRTYSKRNPDVPEETTETVFEPSTSIKERVFYLTLSAGFIVVQLIWLSFMVIVFIKFSQTWR